MPRGGGRGGRGRSLGGYVGAGRAAVGGALSGQSSAQGGGGAPGGQGPAPPPTPPAGPTVLFAEDFEGDLSAWTAAGTGPALSAAAPLAGSQSLVSTQGGGGRWREFARTPAASGVVGCRFRFRYDGPPDSPGTARVLLTFETLDDNYVLMEADIDSTGEAPALLATIYTRTGILTVQTARVPIVAGQVYTVELVYDWSGAAPQGRLSVDGGAAVTADDDSGLPPPDGFFPSQLWVYNNAAQYTLDSISVADGEQGA